MKFLFLKMSEFEDDELYSNDESQEYFEKLEPVLPKFEVPNTLSWLRFKQNRLVQLLYEFTQK